MPIHIEDLSAEVLLHGGPLPLSAAQLDQIADHVIRRLAERRRDEERSHKADVVHGSAVAARMAGARR